MIKLNHSLATWLKCKVVIVQVQVRNPLEEGCSLIFAHTTAFLLVETSMFRSD